MDNRSEVAAGTATMASMSTSHLPTQFFTPFTGAQARAAGVSTHQLRVMRRARLIRQVLYGVYVATEVQDTVELRVAALREVMRPHTIVCDRTAAWLHVIDAFDFVDLEWLPPVETCVALEQTRIRRSECTGCRRELSIEDVITLFGIKVTSPLRTALDLGRSLSRSKALATLDAFLHAGYFNVAALRNEVRRLSGRRGVVQLRELIALADPQAESTGESWARLAIIDAGLPAPESQISVLSNGMERYRLDLGYRRHRVCIEYDGQEFHDNEEARAYDAQRRAWLRDHGWIVIVVRKEDFSPEATERWTTHLREALESRHFWGRRGLRQAG